MLGEARFKVLSNTLLRADRVSDGLLSALDRRDVALWIRDLPTDLNTKGLEQFLGLPWKLVLSEAFPLKALNELERDTTLADPMTRKRGFVQIIDTDPSRIQLPARCLPMYLLNGRGDHLGASDFASRLRRMTMLEELRRSGVRDLFVISGTAPIPPDLTELWASGFRCHLTFVSDSSDAEKEVSAWLAPFGSGATILSLSPTRAIESFLARYTETFPEERHIVRLRDSQGAIHRSISQRRTIPNVRF